MRALAETSSLTVMARVGGIGHRGDWVLIYFALDGDNFRQAGLSLRWIPAEILDVNFNS